jgi:hypothetical protein
MDTEIKMTDVFEYNHSTGESLQREHTADELAQIELDKAEQAEQLAAESAKTAARQAVLDKLGLTADELAALL